MPDFEIGFEPDVGPEGTPDIAKALIAQQANWLYLSSADIENEIRYQCEINPAIIISEHKSVRAGAMSHEEDEIDPLEKIDSPGKEENIETGEGEGYSSSPNEHSEDFFQYAWRRLEDHFGTAFGEEEAIRDEIEKILKKMESYDLPISAIPKELRPWFEDLNREFPVRVSAGMQLTTQHADIIFHRSGQTVHYEINLGFLDRIKYNESASGKKQQMLHFFNYDLFPFQIRNFILARRLSLSMLAEYLIEKQSDFMQAPDLKTALERLRSIYQKDFLIYLKSFGIKRGKSWASRIVRNKLVEVPFQNEYLPLNIFFDEIIGDINVLKKAIEYWVLKDNRPPLKRVDQLAILIALTGRKTASKVISQNLYPYLRKMFPGNKGHEYKLGISGRPGRQSADQVINDSDLTALINKIGFELKILTNKLSTKEITKMRQTAENKEKQSSGHH